MNRSKLKKLIKEVIKERYTRESRPELPGFVKDLLRRNDVGNNISKGRKTAHLLLKSLNQSKNGLLISLFKKNENLYKSYMERFAYDMDRLEKYILLWSYKFAEESIEIERELEKDAEILENHLLQIKMQLKSIIISSAVKTDLGKPNYINAMKENEHLNEIFIEVSQLIDKIFGYGNDIK